MQKIFIIILISFGFATICFPQEFFDERTAFTSAIKLNNGSIEPYINEYIYRFDNANYNVYQEDEFELAKTVKELNNEIKNIPLDKEFFIKYSATFGKYNFETNEFDFQPFTDETFIEILNFAFAPRSSTNTSVQLHFSNGKEVSSLPMEFDKANFLVKMRKDKRSGKVDRTIHLKVSYVLKDYIEIEDVSESRKKITLFAEITKVEAYENPGFLSDPLATISTEYFLKQQREKQEAEKAKADAQINKEAETVKALNKYLSEKDVDKDLKAQIMHTTVEYYKE